jgi:hypothetical protein
MNNKTFGIIGVSNVNLDDKNKNNQILKDNGKIVYNKSLNKYK